MNPQVFGIQNLIIFLTIVFENFGNLFFFMYGHNELHNIYYKDNGDASSQV